MNPVTGYAGHSQETLVPVPARIAYKYIDWEEGPWVMPPYAWLYPAGPTTLEEPPPAPRLSPRGVQPMYKIRWVPTL